MSDAPAAPATPAATPAAATAAPLSAAASLAGGDPTPATPAAPAAPAAAPAAADPAPADPNAPVAVTLPGKDATPEQWAEFYKNIGAPESSDAYELPIPDGDNGEFAKTAAAWFKDAGLLPQQANALASKWNEFQGAQAAAAQAAEDARLQAMDTKNRAEETALKTEWGQKHEANMELAKRAVRQFLPADKSGEIITALEDKLGYAETIKLLHTIGAGLGEHDAAGLGQQSGGKKSAAEILYGGTASK